jgi:hypothetical protein
VKDSPSRALRHRERRRNRSKDRRCFQGDATNRDEAREFARAIVRLGREYGSRARWFLWGAVEIYRHREFSGGERYVLLETAVATGNQLLRFSSKDRDLVYAALSQELGRLLQ